MIYKAMEGRKRASEGSHRLTHTYLWLQAPLAGVMENPSQGAAEARALARR